MIRDYTISLQLKQNHFPVVCDCSIFHFRDLIPFHALLEMERSIRHRNNKTLKTYVRINLLRWALVLLTTVLSKWLESIYWPKVIDGQFFLQRI